VSPRFSVTPNQLGTQSHTKAWEFDLFLETFPLLLEHEDYFWEELTGRHPSLLHPYGSGKKSQFFTLGEIPVIWEKYREMRRLADLGGVPS